MAVVDASIMVAVLHTPDAFHEVSRQWLERHLNAGGTLVAPNLLLSEVAGVISRETQKPNLGHQAVRWLQSLPELTLLSIDAALSSQAAEIAASLGLRGADAQYVALAIQQGLPLVTWDRQQRERGRQRVDAQQPDALLRRLEAMDAPLYDALASAIEQGLQERHPHRTWRVERADERRKIAERSGVPINFDGVTVEGNVAGAGVRQQVGIISVDPTTALDDTFIDRIAKTIEGQIPGLSPS
jgi:predicted nucleic acid-binding protein